MRFAIVLALICGCASSDPSLTEPDMPQSCEVSNDCFWSHCSFSSCVEGACVHEEIANGTTCLDPDVGYGECESSICIVER